MRTTSTTTSAQEDPFFEPDLPKKPTKSFFMTEESFIEEVCREFEDLESGRLYALYGERVA